MLTSSSHLSDPLESESYNDWAEDSGHNFIKGPNELTTTKQLLFIRDYLLHPRLTVVQSAST
jgi:hypothetical protein